MFVSHYDIYFITYLFYVRIDKISYDFFIYNLFVVCFSFVIAANEKYFLQ